MSRMEVYGTIMSMSKMRLKILALAASIVFVLSFVSMSVFADDRPAANVAVPPTPVLGLVDDGSWHDLVNPGYAEGGTMLYSLDGVTWFTTLPAATTVGCYTVYFKASGDHAHSDSRVDTVTVWISRPDAGAFVDYIYIRALGRQADPEARASLVSIVNNGGSANDVVRTVFGSNEFQNRLLNNPDFVEVVYLTLFGRGSDPAGRDSWVNALNNGYSRMGVVEQFMTSSEFTNICLTYGLPLANAQAANITVDAGSKVRDFVGRLYRNCLGRRPDRSGAEYWSSQLQNQTISGTNCAYGFFFSPEFVNAGYSNQDYVTRLYQVFLGRNPDSAGLTNWVTALNSGVSRQEVFYGFAHADEFSRICSEYGIVRG